MSEEKAPFNSALDLLERLSNLLTYITKVKQNVFLDRSLKQGFVLELVKDYYMQSIPLLSSDARKDLKLVLDLKQKEAVGIDKLGRRTQGKKLVYSEELEVQMNEILINVQMNLQDVGKYFMPPRKKLGKVVGEFE